MTRGFSSYHPVVNFLFFAGAVGLSMFISHPAFALCSLLFALGEYLLLTKGKSKSVLLWYGLMLGMVMLCNGLLNPLGETVLLHWLNGRPITAESLFYGAVTGINFVSVMLWFSCYNIIMTTDKFIWLFGRFAPSVTLVLSMILRLIPLLQKRTKAIVSARNCIGKCRTGDTTGEKLQSSMEVLSILTSCALEDAVVTADSMRSRGYVDRQHSSYVTYRWERRDLLLGVVLLLCGGLIIAAIAAGAVTMTYFPSVNFPENSRLTLLGLGAYCLFLSIPSLIELSEEITWNILKSKI